MHMSLLIALLVAPAFAVAAQLSTVHFFASTMDHAGQSNAINLQMTESGTCVVTSYGEFDYFTHQNGVWDRRMQLMIGYRQDHNGSASAIRSWLRNGTDFGTQSPLDHYSTSPTALFFESSAVEPRSLLAFSVQPSMLSRIEIQTGAVLLLLSIAQAEYSWIVPSGAFDSSSALVYQIAYTVNATGAMALSLLTMRTRAPFSYTSTPLIAADASIATLISASGVWGLAVAQPGKSLAAVLPISATESNMLVSIDAITGAVSRLGAKYDEFAGANLMGSILSVNGMLFVDTLDSNETTNRLYAFDALSGSLLAASACADVYNILDFIALEE
jgi:hypothetical protein